MMKLREETAALLDDIERRIDPETEDALNESWLRFLNGTCEEDIFRPARNRRTPPGTPLPGININDALADYETMIAGLYRLQEKWGVTVIDLYNDAEFNQITEEERALYMADSIHPTKAGYRDWWLPKFEEALTGLLP